MKRNFRNRLRTDESAVFIAILLVVFFVVINETSALDLKDQHTPQADTFIDPITVIISSKAAPPGVPFTISVFVSQDVTPNNIISMQFTLTYDASLLSFRTATAGDLIPEGGQFFFGYDEGRIYAAAASADSMMGKGTLARIEFRVLNSAQIGQTCLLSFERFLFNEPPYSPELKFVDGLFIVGSFPDIELSAREYDFGAASVGSSVNWDLTISNTGWADLDIEDISGPTQDFGVTIPSFPLTVAPASDTVVSVYFSPSDLGDRSGILTIRNNDYFENEVMLSLTGVGIAPDVALSDREHSFGQVPLGYASDWDFKVYNIGNADLIIDSVLVYPLMFQSTSPMFPQIVTVGESLRVTTQFVPDELGQAAGVLTLFSNDPDEHAVDVFLSGVGVPPEADILIATTVHEFGGVYLGNKGAWSMPISNIGTAPLTIDSISSNSEEFEVTFPVFPKILNPASGIDAVVSFQPVSEDSVNAILTVFSDDPDEPTTSVTVSGFGVKPATLTVLGGVGNPGSVVNQVPIAMTNQHDIASVEFVLNYAESVLTPAAAIPAERSEDMETFQVILNYDVGKVKLSISGQIQRIFPGSGTIAKIAFNVAEDAPSGDYLLALSEVTSYDAQGREVSFVLQDSVFTIPSVGVEEEENATPGLLTYALFQNYPNPFNPSTFIEYSVVEEKPPPQVTLTVFNLLGQEVRILENEPKKAGYYTVMWDGTDGSGQDVPTGIYLCRLEVAGFVSTKKMILAR